VTKRVYIFGETSKDLTMEEGKELLGGKGAALDQMTKLDLPIPPGFTITTHTCMEFLGNNNTFPEGLWEDVLSALKQVENNIGKKFGDVNSLLLLSVRSGAKRSMPGMMDTILNLGLNEDIVNKLKDREEGRFIMDSYRRLIFMFSNVALGLDIHPFEELLDKKKKEVGVENDSELSTNDLEDIIKGCLKIFEAAYGKAFPQDPLEQLRLAIEAVFKSWNNKRAFAYREFEGISHDSGTAVNVQSMVFGNKDDNSGTGVLFTRNPSTGQKEIYGEYLINAQGEDVVAGLRTPVPISKLKNEMPKIYDQLSDISVKLEKYYKDMQDIEFTIESGKLYILQTRAGKRTGVAAARISQEFVNENIIDKEEAIMRITPRDIESSLFPSVVWKDPKNYSYFKVEDIEAKLKNSTLDEIVKNAESDHAKLIGKGLPAGPGAAVGHIIFSSDQAEAIANGDTPAPFEVKHWRNNNGKKIPSLILVKKETSPEDFHGMVASAGILTMSGGMTSHAALVGRQIGKRVIVGGSTSGLELLGEKLRSSDENILTSGDVITLEIFGEGLVFDGALPVYTPHEISSELETILDWADEVAEIKVRANADKENDTTMAFQYKSTGTGLARTEHMFFDALDYMQEMILAETKEERQIALDKMRKLQIEDFEKIFRVAKGKPITIRLLDPPLHEFLPNELEIRQQIWQQILNPIQTEKNTKILRKVVYYQEANPMLGLRGVRLGLMFPEILIMQVKAILEAAITVEKEGIKTIPEIMIPLIGSTQEFAESRKIVDKTAKHVFEKHNIEVEYLVGTMIEIPRAALIADRIANGEKGADFFSFGTNDLHQMALGFSRDDVGKFLPYYLENGIIAVDPFQTIDEHGTGILMDICVEKGRNSAKKANKYLKIGVCGEQGGDPRSIDFCYRIGLDYVSCSPFRIPIARLAAGQVTIKNRPIRDQIHQKYGKIWPTPDKLFLE
jgi:pyruvate, orthophosphate dikinase